MAGKSLARTFLTAFALAKTAQVFYDDKRNHEKELINGLLRFGFTHFNDSGMDSCLTAKVQRPQGLRITGVIRSEDRPRLLNKNR